MEKRKIKSEFFEQINKLIDRGVISQAINKHYSKGNSATGRPSYDGLLLFKMTLLQTWYGLSDYELEDSVNDRISFSKFVGLSIEDKTVWLKKHFVTDENGMVLGVLTTSANVNEISNLADVLEKVDLPQNATIKADKGYKSERNDSIVSEKGLRNHIMFKAKKNKPLTQREL